MEPYDCDKTSEPAGRVIGILTIWPSSLIIRKRTVWPNVSSDDRQRIWEIRTDCERFALGSSDAGEIDGSRTYQG